MARIFEEIYEDLNRLTGYEDWEDWEDFREEIMHEQNNEHHLEGNVGEHIVLMLKHARKLAIAPKYESANAHNLSHKEFHQLAKAIVWSDLGKLACYSEPINEKTGEYKRVWEDGTPQGAAYGHAEKSAEMYVEYSSEPRFFGIGVDPLVHWVVLNHMEAHRMVEWLEKGLNDKGKFSKKLNDFTQFPDFLREVLDDGSGEILDNWLWPDYQDLDITTQNLINKQTYKMTNLYYGEAGKMLRMKQECDSKGRITKDSQ